MNQIQKIIIASLLALWSSTVFAANYFAEAKNYYDKGEYKAAIIQLKNQLKENPKDARARYLLGKSYLKVGDVKQADKEISRSYELEPDNEEFTLLYAQMLLRQKKYINVKQILAKEFSNLELDQQRKIYMGYALIGENNLFDAKHIFLGLVNKIENFRVYNGLAIIASLENDTEAAQQWLEKSIALEPENIESLETKARIEVTSKKYEKALTTYNKLINKQGNKLSLYLERSAVKIELNDLEGAQNDLQKMLDKVKHHPQANYLLAQIKLREKKYKESQVAAQNVLNRMPHHYNSMLILGLTNFSQGYYNQADKYLTQYLSANPDNIDVQNILANVYLALQDGEQAILILEGIDEKTRNSNVKILTTLGSAYLLNGEHQKGLEALNKAKSLEPDNEVIQKRLIAGQVKAGDFDSAIAGLEKIVESGQSNQNTNYLLVVSYIQQKELQKAEVRLSQLLKKTPDDPGLYNLVAIVETLQENNQKAKEAYKQAIKINNKFIPAYIGLGQLATLEKDWKSAKELYSKVIEINEKYIRAYIYLAAVAEKQKNEKEMEMYLQSGFDFASGNVKSQTYIATLLSKLYAKQNAPEKIMPIAQDLNRIYPNNNTALSFFAGAQIANKKLEQAQQTLKLIINNDSTDVNHRLLLADLLVDQGNREEEVLTLLNDVIRIIPNNPEPVRLKIEYLIKQKKYQQAAEAADYAEQQFPDKALGKQTKGDLFRIENKLDKALEYYQAAYQIQPGNKLLFSISDLLIVQGKDNEAIKLLKDELNKKPMDSGILFKLGGYYQAKNQLDTASQYYKKMLEIKSDNILALNNLAWIYLHQNNSEAVVMARKAYERAPQLASIVDTYGYILIKQGDYKQGVALLEKAVKLAPEAYDIQYHLAEAYSLDGNKVKAKKLLQKIVISENDFSKKESAVELLNKL